MAATVKTFLDPTRFTVSVASSSGGGTSSTPAGVITPLAYGGAPDGTTDNYQAIAQAAAAAAAQKLPLYIPAGAWVLGSGLTLPAGLEVYGESGSVLHVSTSEWYFPFMSLNDSCYVHDLTFVCATGRSMGSPAGASGLRLSNCQFFGCAVNSFFACVDSTIDGCTVDGSVGVAKTTTALAAGTAYTSLGVEGLETSLTSGQQLYLYVDPTYADETFQVVYTSSAVAAGATSIPLQPVTALADIPAGSSVRNIVVSTGLSMTGAYDNWNSTPGPGDAWVVNSAIQNCTVRNCDAADVFINMGYKCLMQNNYGSVGHDMNFDFEYCVQSIMQNNEGHFGGNRGCAVETINSECQVLDNKIYDTLWDGIRATTDLVPSGNARPIGGHVVSGNYVRRANRGIAFQAVPGSTMAGNDVAECLLTGAHLYNIYPGLVKGNNIHDNYGTGIELLNSSQVANPVTINGNRITQNGYLNGVAPARAALQGLTVASGTSTLAPGDYAISYSWVATVATRGGLYSTWSSPSLPALATVTAVGQVVQLPDLTLPTGIDGVAVFVFPASYINQVIPWYSRPATGLADYATAIGGLLLGQVAADGTITYDGGATAGLSASVPSTGVLRIDVTGPAPTQGTIASYSFGCCSGVWANPGTGAVAGVVLQDNTITDNGSNGVQCPGSVSGGNVSGHTAAALAGIMQASTAQLSGSLFGIFPPPSSGHGTFEDCQISDIGQDCIHFSAAVNGQCWDYTINGCTFSGAPVGIYMDAAVTTGRGGDSTLAPFPGDATSPVQPSLVEHCTFTNVQTPIDKNSGTQDVLTIGTGNVGV